MKLSAALEYAVMLEEVSTTSMMPAAGRVKSVLVEWSE